MPTPSPQLLLNDVRDSIRQRCFSPVSSRQVGVELEWLTVARGDAGARVDPDGLRHTLAAAGPSPGGSTVTFEPGGQLELSSPPYPNVDQACAAASADVAWAAAGVDRLDVRLVGLGADPLRPPRRVVATPRYDAMEAYFDEAGPAGRRMMCNTAAVQVNVGVGPGADDAARQWRLAQRLGPTLAAAFANSPLFEGRPTGFRSSRLATWLALDRSRTAPVDSRRPGPDAWADYVVDAQVMFIPPLCRPPSAPLSFGQWVVEGHDLGWPTTDDLDHHLSTLFPPVRPRGWLELRMIDVLPDPWWQVPVAVVAALLGDPEAGDAADRALCSTAADDRWVDAARTGLCHPALAESARACFAAALAGLERMGTEAPVVDTVAAYADRWVDRGRSPADDHLDAWAASGTLFPETAGSLT